ncbi:hypothetical protein Plhal304r1_c029g0094241 [Plasmopara halstedii]
MSGVNERDSREMISSEKGLKWSGITFKERLGAGGPCMQKEKPVLNIVDACYKGFQRGFALLCWHYTRRFDQGTRKPCSHCAENRNEAELS